MPNVLLRFTLFFLLFQSSFGALHAGCIDSVHWEVQAVKCNGLRNGVIEIVKVYSEQPPFYYSLDGQSYSTRPVFDLLWAGEYTLYVRDATGCEQVYNVLVPEPEKLQVSLSIDDTSVVAGSWIQVTATVSPSGANLAAISWRPPGLFAVQNKLVQEIRLVEDTDIAIEIRNQNDCIARDNLSITVEQTNVYFPNVFAPGSSQDNYFTLFAGEGVERIALLQVFDRSGSMVYEKRNFYPNDPQSGWNGKWRGRQAPPGVYPWVAKVEFLDGNTRQFSGSVTLIQE